MEKKTATISFKTTETLRSKLGFMANQEDRSMSSKIERMIKREIREWEQINGPIPLIQHP
jgi:hypothetical protein